MKTRTLYNRRKMFIACLLSMALLTGVCVPPSFSNVYTIEAKANPLVPIGNFLGRLGTQVTLAETIISSLLSAGAAVTDMSWLNQLNNAYGTTAFSVGEMYSQGLFEVVENAATGTYEIIDNGFIQAVESVSAYHDLGIDTLFEVTAADQDILPGIAAATGGTTLLKTILSGVTLGAVGAAAGAVAGGIAVGVLANHIYNKWKAHINAGAPVSWTAGIPEGSIYRDVKNKNNSMTVYFDFENTNGYYYDTGTGYYSLKVLKNKGFSGVSTTINVSANGSQTQSNSNIGANTVEVHSKTISINNFESQTGFSQVDKSTYDSLVNDANNYNLVTVAPFSPDIITQHGNAKGNDTIQSPLDSDEGMEIVPWGDYIQDFVDPANTNTSDNLPDDNEDVWRDFVDPYIITVPEPLPIPNPNPTDPQPTIPDTTTPDQITSDPITDPVPQQPDYDDKPELTTEDIADGGPYTVPNLLDKFPFCIPKDIHDLFAVMASGSRQAPRLKFDYVSTYFDYEIHLDIDLSAFDEAANVFRILELILFILGLALATKNLIKW